MLAKIICFLQLHSLQVMPTVGVFPTCPCPVSHNYHGAAYHPTFPKCFLTGSHGDWGFITQNTTHSLWELSSPHTFCLCILSIV